MPTPVATAGRDTSARTDTAWQSIIVDPECPKRRGRVNSNHPSGQSRLSTRTMDLLARVAGTCYHRSSMIAHASPILPSPGPPRTPVAVRARSRSSPRNGASRRLLPPPPASRTYTGGSSPSPTSTPKGGAPSVSTALHDPTVERDACGIGLVADARARASRELVDRALAGLAAVVAPRRVGGRRRHRRRRRAPAAAPPLAHRRLLRGRRDVLPPRAVAARCRRGGVPRGAPRAARLARRAARRRRAGLDRRRVRAPHRPARARAVRGRADAELRAHRARRRAELVEGVYVASLSFRTVTYKALCAATQLDELLPRPPGPRVGGSVGDLPPAVLDEHRAELGARAAVPPALPQRRDQHDRGERRLDGGARARARRRPGARARPRPVGLRLGAARQRARAARPFRASTSREALSQLVPARLAERPARRRRGARDAPLPRDARRAVGRAGRARLHRRRHLRREARPQRAAAAARRGRAATGSSSSPPRPAPCRSPRASPVRRGRLGPGQLLAVDPRHGLRFDGELTRELARAGRTPAGSTRPPRFGEQGEPAAPPDGDLAARHALHGYTREELSLMLRPIAQTGQEPVYSMGDDAPIAPLAGRARPLASYFRQRFAQVTNPAIDHYRERTVMSVATLVGPEPPLGAEGPLQPLVVLPSFLVTPAGLAALDPEFRRRDLRPRTRASAGGRARRGRRCARSSRRARPPSASATSAAAGGRAPIPVASRRRRRPRAADRARAAHGVLAPRPERRDARHPHGRDAGRLRRRRHLPAPRARDGRAPRGDRQGRRRPALTGGGAAPAPARARGRRPQGDVEARDLGRGELPRRPALRGRRARPAPLPPVLRRDAVCDRRDRARPARARGARAARRERGARSRRSRTPASTSSARAASRTRPTRTSSRRCRRA